MSQKFDLYDKIVISTEEQPPRKRDMRKLCSIISSFPKEHRIIMQLLILHHEQLNGSGSKTWRANPFKGRTFEGGKGVIYNFNFFPPDLQDIIARYVEMITVKE